MKKNEKLIETPAISNKKRPLETPVKSNKMFKNNRDRFKSRKE
jgi:hypothetical protein